VSYHHVDTYLLHAVSAEYLV
ncbi:hypothetical protein D018_5201B, partial [Vibrio parahaemolyticus VP2007-007]